jgi:hypothetical protein
MPSHPGRRLRAGLLVASALLLAGSLHDLRDFRRERRALVEEWETSGMAARHPEAGRRVRRDPDLVDARLAMARASTADALAPAWLGDLPPAAAAREADRLERRLLAADAVARATLARRPISWEAALIAGAVALAADVPAGPDATAGSAAFVRLEHAARLAPTRAEPRRLLAAAHLLAWPAYDRSGRERAVAALTTAFADADLRRELLPAWLAVAGGDDLARPFPADPAAWRQAREIFARSGDWARVCAAWEEETATSHGLLTTRLAEAAARQDGGDHEGARRLFLDVAATAPPDRRFAPLLADAVRRLPPGPVSDAAGERLVAWVRWHLELATRDLPGLPDDVVQRLLGLASGLTDGERAAAAQLAGDERAAASAVRRSDRLWSEEWADYLVARARQHAAAGDPAAAADLLQRVHRARRRGWAWERAAGSAGGDQPPWVFRRGTPAGEVVVERPAAIEIPLAEVPAGGTALVIAIDGAAVACAPLGDGTGPLRPPVRLPPGPHLVELRALGPGAVIPAAPRLVAAGEPG